MPNIDFSKLETAEARAHRRLDGRRAALKAEATRRIDAVLDQKTQFNLIAAAVAGALSPAEMVVFRASRRWIADTLEASRIAAAGDKPEWPERPSGLAQLVTRY